MKNFLGHFVFTKSNLYLSNKSGLGLRSNLNDFVFLYIRTQKIYVIKAICLYYFMLKDSEMLITQSNHCFNWTNISIWAVKFYMFCAFNQHYSILPL